MPDRCTLYVHFPYCVTRCSYCDFNTYVVEDVPVERYARAVLREGDARAPAYGAWPLASIYFGGGTPSLWGARAVGAVIEAAARWFPERDALEVTLECNPGEATPELLAAYRAAGVNRLSLGVQSLDDAILRAIDRRHDADRALAALRDALAAGFDSVSADLMFGLPGQTMARWTQDLVTLAETGVPHLSVYHLTLEPGTAMTREVQAGRVVLPDEDLQADMWDALEPTLSPYGLQAYEVSNFAWPGHESRHNTSYWLGRPYLGLGAGAHSLLVPGDFSAPGAAAERTSNRRHHSAYVSEIEERGTAVAEREPIDRELHLRERLFTGLRLKEGIALDALQRDVGLDPLAEHGAVIRKLIDEGLVTLREERLALTERGLRYANDVFLRFF